MAAHGYPRATIDMDIWVEPSPENAEAVLRALARFGAALHGLNKADLLKNDTVFQIGMAPRRIDILTGVSGLEFNATFDGSVPTFLEKIPLRIPSIPDLIRNKRATGRTKDLADAEALEMLSNPDSNNMDA